MNVRNVNDVTRDQPPLQDQWFQIKHSFKMDSGTARANFELANSITSVSSVDSVFRYDNGKQQELLASKPWTKE